MKFLYDPYDPSTWTSELDKHETSIIQDFLEKNVQMPDNNISRHHFNYILGNVMYVLERLIICVLLYSKSSKVSFWKERIIYYVSTFAKLNLKPIRKNKMEIRQHYLNSALLEYLDDSKSSLLLEIKDVKDFIDIFSSLGEMTPEEQVISCEECYRLYGTTIVETMRKIGKHIAEQNPDAIKELVDKIPVEGAA